MLKSSLPQRVKEALGMSIVESEDLVADARLFPVIRVALTNDPSRSLSAEALVRFAVLGAEERCRRRRCGV